jgi:hypothetical protein
MRATKRLTIGWFALPAAVIIVVIVVFGIKALAS